jgi:hypothetical protein
MPISAAGLMWNIRFRAGATRRLNANARVASNSSQG